MDIRSYFKALPSKSKTTKAAPNKKPTTHVIIDSDEDIISETPPQTNKKHNRGNKSPHKDKTVSKKKSKSKVQVISSDSEDDVKVSPKKGSKTASPPKLKPINIFEKYNKTITQSHVEKDIEVETVSKVSPKKSKSKLKQKSKPIESSIHEDDGFERTLMELDEDELLHGVEVLETSLVKPANETVCAPIASTSSKENSPKDLVDKHDNSEKERNDAISKKRVRESSEATPRKRTKLEHVDSGIGDDQDRFEKKKYCAMQFEKYKNRTGPKHHGSKELPKGKENCLQNLTFLRTGVLDSLESEEFEDLLKKHGGRVVRGVSKKVNYVVAGEDAGPAKLAKAQSYGIPTITEDELLDLILVKSGMEPKYVLKAQENEYDLKQKKVDSPKKKKSPKSSPVKSHNASSKTKEFKETALLSSVKKLESKTIEVKKASTSKLASKNSQTYSKEIVKYIDLPQITRDEVVVPTENQSWVEKYKPRKLTGVIGQNGEGSNLFKLKKWLENWEANQRPEKRQRLVRPSPWSQNDDGAYFKCALLSGPPGVGKTTTATLVCKDLGYDLVEFNASDTRSKKLLQTEVSQLLSTNSIAGFATGKPTVKGKRVLIMDEVDGMAGNEDRGGIQELINLIKNSKIPIICMCNDRNHQKMRTLVNYCFDLKFAPPKKQQILGALKTICFRENVKISNDALNEIIEGTGCDVRQTINNLALWTLSQTNLSAEEAGVESKKAKKDVCLGPWEVIRKVFTESEHKDMSIAQKSQLFFYDYSLGPLFVQENYLKVKPKGVRNEKEQLRRLALAADSISLGDLVDVQIRTRNNWSLLESQAMLSSVLPGHYLSGTLIERVNFPSWLGKNSTKNKCKRIIMELQSHSKTRTFGGKRAMRLDYLVPLRDAINRPLKIKEMEGIDESLEVLKYYNLSREDLDSIMDMTKKMTNPYFGINTKVKAAFTRKYNKEQKDLNQIVSTVSKKRKVVNHDDDFLEDDENYDSPEENEDNILTDALIKVKNPDANGKKTTSGKAQAKPRKPRTEKKK